MAIHFQIYNMENFFRGMTNSGTINVHYYQSPAKEDKDKEDKEDSSASMRSPSAPRQLAANDLRHTLKYVIILENSVIIFEKRENVFHKATFTVFL